MGFLKIAAADFRTRNMRCNGQDRHPRAMTIEKTINQMQIAGATAAGTDGKLTGQMRFRACGESGGFLMPGMNPVDVAASAQRFGNAIEAIADNAIDAANADRVEHLRDNVSSFHGLGAEHLRDNVHGLISRNEDIGPLADDELPFPAR
jgi:hypothetical protein